MRAESFSNELSQVNVSENSNGLDLKGRDRDRDQDVSSRDRDVSVSGPSLRSEPHRVRDNMSARPR